MYTRLGGLRTRIDINIDASFNMSVIFELKKHYQSFIYSPIDTAVSYLKKTILKFSLKFTLKQLRHVSVQLHHHQGAH